jgi:DNA-binding transcriptional ArsR family regulator
VSGRPIHTDPLRHALASKVRRAILRHLYRQGPGRKMSVRELSDELQRPRSNVYYHVNTLAEAGAIRLAEGSGSDDESTEAFYYFNVTADWALALLRDGADPLDGASDVEDGTP